VGNKLSDFKIICELGRGSYGVVNKVLSLVDNNEYVMKKINMKHIKLKHQKEALKEAQILRRVRHPNIIRYYTSFVEDEHLYIIMEYAEGGDLAVVKCNVYI
jgi:Serine/threonine protein kinase